MFEQLSTAKKLLLPIVRHLSTAKTFFANLLSKSRFKYSRCFSLFFVYDTLFKSQMFHLETLLQVFIIVRPGNIQLKFSGKIRNIL